MDPTGPRPWHMLFGIDRPTCGVTGMTWYLLRGDLVDTAREHRRAAVGARRRLTPICGRWPARRSGGACPSCGLPRPITIGAVVAFPPALGGATQASLATVRLVLCGHLTS